MFHVAIAFLVVSLVANGILGYLLWATRKWFRLYRAGLDLQGNRTGVPGHLR